MKGIRILLAAIILEALLLSTACAAGLSGLVSSAGALPDPAALLGGKAFLYEEDVMDSGISYTAFTFTMPKDYDSFLSRYIPLAEAAGYTVSEGHVLEADAVKIASGARFAFLIPDYRGALLLLVNPALDYAALPTPTPTPRPTPKPTPRHAVPFAPDSPIVTDPSGGGHVEYIEVKQDCFACINGKCDLCDGSGWYRNYGEKVPCSIYCETCSGLGYWYTRQSIWVP